MKRKVISMILRRWKGFCLAAEEEALFPQGAEMCGEVFAPLVFLVRRDPLRARGLYPIRDLSELDEPEDIGCLTPSSPAEGELAAFVRAHGAGGFGRCRPAGVARCLPVVICRQHQYSLWILGAQCLSHM